MTPRHTRFWLIGLFLILGNVGYMAYKLAVLKQSLTIPEMIFHGVVLLVAVSTFDKELGKYWADKLVGLAFSWRKNGSDRPPPAEG